jgi:hypothetical protein
MPSHYQAVLQTAIHKTLDHQRPARICIFAVGQLRVKYYTAIPVMGWDVFALV